MLDHARFFDVIRRKPYEGRLSQSQVDGIGAMLDAAPPDQDVRWTAYELATAHHETNGTMRPVREAYWLSEDWRQRHLRYYPFYGRGFVQLTWRANYERAGKELGLDLLADLDLALRLDVASKVMQRGMTEGWFTGHKLGDYFSDRRDDAIQARRIINGLDRAELVAGYYRAFLAALKGAETSAA